MKKLLPLSVVCITIFSFFTGPIQSFSQETYSKETAQTFLQEQESPFLDESLDTLSGQAAATLYHLDILKGYPDGELKGNTPINRAETAKLLLLAGFEEVDEVRAEGDLFWDTAPNAWYAPYIAIAAEENIIHGYPDHSFRPEQTVNTAEFLKMFTKTFALEEELPYSYHDIDKNAWYSKYVGSAETYHLFPYRTHELSPDTPLTRNDVIIALYQYFTTQETEDDYEVQDNFQELNTSEGTTIVVYSVQEGQTLKEGSMPSVPQDFQTLQLQKEKHALIWEYVRKIFPLAYREKITTLELFSDGAEGTLAAVEQNPSQEGWILYIDIVDAFDTNETLNTEDLSYTLIHELYHIISLDNTQLIPETSIPENDTDMEKEMRNQRAACAPNFYIEEGCTRTHSYLNLFVEKFWLPILAENKAITQEEDPAIQEEGLTNFYETYKEHFVTEYAATNPVEDGAESFASFVLQSNKEPKNTIAEQKQHFFYEFPELVAVRIEIRKNLEKNLK